MVGVAAGYGSRHRHAGGPLCIEGNVFGEGEHCVGGVRGAGAVGGGVPADKHKAAAHKGVAIDCLLHAVGEELGVHAAAAAVGIEEDVVEAVVGRGLPGGHAVVHYQLLSLLSCGHCHPGRTGPVEHVAHCSALRHPRLPIRSSVVAKTTDRHSIVNIQSVDNSFIRKNRSSI